MSMSAGSQEAESQPAGGKIHRGASHLPLSSEAPAAPPQLDQVVCAAQVR